MQSSSFLTPKKKGGGGEEREKTVLFAILCTKAMYQRLGGPLSLCTLCWQDGAQAADCFVCQTQKKDHKKLMGIQSKAIKIFTEVVVLIYGEGLKDATV